MKFIYVIGKKRGFFTHMFRNDNQNTHTWLNLNFDGWKLACKMRLSWLDPSTEDLWVVFESTLGLENPLAGCEIWGVGRLLLERQIHWNVGSLHELKHLLLLQGLLRIRVMNFELCFKTNYSLYRWMNAGECPTEWLASMNSLFEVVKHLICAIYYRFMSVCLSVSVYLSTSITKLGWWNLNSFCSFFSNTKKQKGRKVTLLRILTIYNRKGRKKPFPEKQTSSNSDTNRNSQQNHVM